MSAPLREGVAPAVSVVIPSFNRREILSRCLDALVAQTHPDFEVIVVDDGSTDGTPEFLDRYASDHAHNFPRVFQLDPNFLADPRPITILP